MNTLDTQRTLAPIPETIPASSCQGPLIAEGHEDAARVVVFLGILVLAALICWGIWAAAT